MEQIKRHSDYDFLVSAKHFLVLRKHCRTPYIDTVRGSTEKHLAKNTKHPLKRSVKRWKEGREMRKMEVCTSIAKKTLTGPADSTCSPDRSNIVPKNLSRMFNIQTSTLSLSPLNVVIPRYI